MAIARMSSPTGANCRPNRENTFTSPPMKVLHHYLRTVVVDGGGVEEDGRAVTIRDGVRYGFAMNL